MWCQCYVWVKNQDSKRKPEGTHLTTGLSPLLGGEFGTYITNGKSGGLVVGSQPKNDTRRLFPVFAKSSGIGGSC